MTMVFPPNPALSCDNGVLPDFVPENFCLDSGTGAAGRGARFFDDLRAANARSTF
jgi:hypothetical protein